MSYSFTAVSGHLKKGSFSPSFSSPTTKWRRSNSFPTTHKTKVLVGDKPTPNPVIDSFSAATALRFQLLNHRRRKPSPGKQNKARKDSGRRGKKDGWEDKNDRGWKHDIVQYRQCQTTLHCLPRHVAAGATPEYFSKVGLRIADRGSPVVIWFVVYCRACS
jgi:hypothetical protein